MKKYFLFIALICSAVVVHAQGSSFSIQYSVGFGSGDVGTYISSPSFRGATMEWKKFLQPNFSLGGELGWNVFYSAQPNDTYTSGTASLTGKQFRYQNQFPILFTSNYFWNPGEKLRPFVGLGIGTMYSRRNTDMSTYTLEQQAWHFALRPEAGVLYSLSDYTSLYLGLKYYQGFKSGDFTSDQSYFTINVGFVFGQQ